MVRVLITAVAIAISSTFSGVLAADLNGDMDFKLVTTGGNCLTCSFVRADGDITSDTPKRFIEFVKKSGFSNFNGVDIHLNSDGGNLIGGVELGVTFRELGVSTIVSASKVAKKYENSEIHSLDPDFNGADAQCASACAFSFLGGVERYATPNVSFERVGFQLIGRIGVHQFYSGWALTDPDRKVFSAKDASADQQIVSLLLAYLKEMNVSAEVLQLASSTDPSEMHWMTPEELRATNVDNASFSTTHIEAYRNGVAIVEFRYQRMDAAIRNEVWCRDGKLHMLTTLSSKGGAILKPGSEWQLFGNMTLGVDGPRVELVKHKSYWDKDAEIIQMTFAFQQASAEQLTQLKDFNFYDASSRYALRAAEQLSFSLPEGFDGMHILPRTCQ